MSEEKRKRQTISVTDKLRLVKAYNTKQNWRVIAEQMKISKYTAKSIVYTWKKFNVLSKGKIGGHKKPIISNVIGKSLLKFTDSNVKATLKDKAAFLQSNYHINVSESTVHNFLKKYVIPKVELSDHTEKNSSTTKQERHDYVKYLCDNGFLPEECIYIGETTLYGPQGINISLFMAISTQGVLYSKITEGSFDSSKCQEFVDELTGIFLEEKFLFIMDNSWINLQIAFENSLHSVKFTPPHSLFLNPSNGIFNELKADVETKINTIKSEDSLSRDCEQFVDLIKGCIHSIDVNRFKSFFKHGITYYVSCLNYSDIFDV